MSETPVAARFDAAMRDLGPFGPCPRLAVAVSGGADSTALALLAHDWAQARSGTSLALIVDHGLRPAAAAEAALTAQRLQARGLATQIITLAIPPGSAVQERARIARHHALASAAAAAGAVHLLFGHHAADQAEGLAMRAARGPGGAAGMAGFAARHDVVLLRPLLTCSPADLRALLRQWNVAWIDDPSNSDPRFERVRVRLHQSLTHTAATAAHLSAQTEAVRHLADHARIDPAGFVLLQTDHLPPAALAALIRAIGGSLYPPARTAVDRLAKALRPATLGGVHIMRAGRLGPGWLLCREFAACAPPVPAHPGTHWDNRFQVREVPPVAETIGALGTEAARFRSRNGLPSAVLRTLPAFFDKGAVVAVPHLQPEADQSLLFMPPAPVVAAPFTSAPP
ncbi:tRNA lysidine(34) synthetase TilS [Acidiphilium sp. PA]|uniref:tRNA lysidine(34) synthetase TilS n=1 Tax=Acidiphilium sp. PA TaxID=2871705 RepID=UPI0022437CB4|nr:tRNA lysidine(34) synthetase TilS [Acidiphilium sp. PA]MCW8306999.1 tRNA lysidine(34) synthetase TilS [Acidiphilium sp. PA]